MDVLGSTSSSTQRGANSVAALPSSVLARLSSSRLHHALLPYATHHSATSAPAYTTLCTIAVAVAHCHAADVLHRRARILILSSTQLLSSSRARPTARNASAYAQPPPACACPRAYRKTALAATAPGRVQRHWRVNRRHKGPQKTATRRLLCDVQNPVKARRDGMLVASSATIYTCNGFWYNQPSSTERFRYVLLPARCMRCSC